MLRRSFVLASLFAGPVALAGACSASPDLESLLQLAPPIVGQDWHVGPDVYVADTGTARFVEPLYEAFDAERANELVAFIDGFYRAPANEGYDEVLDRLADELHAAGFGGDDDRLQLEFLEEPEMLAWTPISAELVLRPPGEQPRVLHAFEEPDDPDRVMLPVNSPSCDIEGEVALNLDEVKRGMVLVTDVSATQVLRRAQSRGAAAVISASLEPFNEDASGEDRHLDAIQFRTLDEPETAMPVAQISLHSLHAIEEAVQRAAVRRRKVRLAFRAQVLREMRPMRTLAATVIGAERPDEAVAMVSHVQEPGACDNATGVAGLLESARDLAGLLESGKLSWPSRSLVFLWGDEFRQSEVWLQRTEMTPVAGISSDMTGQSKDTGAIALLERMPDPGALLTLSPDFHTTWGAGQVRAENLSPNGFAVIARCAMVDVGLLEGGWDCADHPWEGGSDHDVFIARGVPAVLFWHFEDFTYHTSLDRMRYVDPTEMRRTAVAILATALAVADPEPADLDRYVRSVEQERLVRVAAAREAENADHEALWELWCRGAREWLRNECLGIDEELPATDDH